MRPRGKFPVNAPRGGGLTRASSMRVLLAEAVPVVDQSPLAPLKRLTASIAGE